MSVQSSPAPAAPQRVIAFPNLSATSPTSTSTNTSTSTTTASSSSTASAPSATRPTRSTLRTFPYSLTAPNPWYITQEQLTALSPSTSDGITPTAQTLLRAETADFISQMGQHCKITQLAIATGSVYLHVFFTRFSFARFDRFEIAATCLFLAGKVEERRTRVDQVINAYYHVRLNPPTTPTPASAASSSSATHHSTHQSLSSAIHLLPPSPTSPEYEALRNRIYSLEFVVLDAIEFQFELTHPYTNLMVFLRETILGPKYANRPEKVIHNETSEKGGLAQIAWLFINDSLRSTLCLLYPPDVICVGVIALSLKYKEMDEPVRYGVPVTERTKPWHEELFGVDRQTIEHISDVILTCVELRYKPDPLQAQALLAEKVSPPVNTALPVTSLPPTISAAVPPAMVGGAGQSSRSVISIPLPGAGPAGSSASRSRPSAGAGGRGNSRPSDQHSRAPQRPVEQTNDVIERIVPTSLQHQQQQSAQPRHTAAMQPSASNPASQPQKVGLAATARPPQQKKGYVWKPPAKSRRPTTAQTAEAAPEQQKPAAPTRPVSPSTPPSPFLSNMSPSSRPPSPFLQSLSPMSASKRKDSSVAPFTTTASRKRPHSPAAASGVVEVAVPASARSLARIDSDGASERQLVEQLGQKMRVVSGDDKADRELGTLNGNANVKAADEERHEEEQHGVLAAEQSSVRVILDDLHGTVAKSDKRDELAMMDDLDKFRAEMADGDTDGATAAMADDSVGGEGESVDDVRAWKRARHDERDSPLSPSLHDHAAAMATPWEREDGDGDGAETEHESEFDHSQPSSPAALDESEHRLDQFATVKLQSGGYIASHERQLVGDGGEQPDGMDDGDATLSGYPSKACREPNDSMNEHSLLTT